jgi:hypothetical protein
MVGESLLGSFEIKLNIYFFVLPAVQLVGYNEDAPVPYWIVRNSWGDQWGNDGYIYLEMGKNTCGLADEASIVQL